jgi:hypothetical protein
MIDYLLHHLLTEMPGLKGIRFKLRFSGASWPQITTSCTVFQISNEAEEVSAVN